MFATFISNWEVFAYSNITKYSSQFILTCKTVFDLSGMITTLLSTHGIIGLVNVVFPEYTGMIFHLLKRKVFKSKATVHSLLQGMWESTQVAAIENCMKLGLLYHLNVWDTFSRCV